MRIWWTTQAFWGVYVWLNEAIEHDEKVTLTPEYVTRPNFP